MKKGPAVDLKTGLQTDVRAIEPSEEPRAEIRLAPIEGLEADQVATSVRTTNEELLSKPPNQAIKKSSSPELIELERASNRPRTRASKVTSSQTTIPWYVVGLVLLMIFLFVAAFVVVALNSNGLLLPITLPG
jgi:hypothetical protein